jgi:hypothetical protein
MCFAELADASGHLWKQIAGLKFKIIFVEIRHRYSGIRRGKRRSKEIGARRGERLYNVCSAQ